MVKTAVSLPRARRWQRTKKLMFKHRWTYVLLIPTFVILLLFHYFPMYGIQLAFKDFVVRKGITGSPWVGLKHFRVLMKSIVFKRAVINTLFISSYKLVFGDLSGTKLEHMSFKTVTQMPPEDFKQIADKIFTEWTQVLNRG